MARNCNIPTDVTCNLVKACETQTTLGVPVIIGNTLTIKYTGEDGIEQTQSVTLPAQTPDTDTRFDNPHFGAGAPAGFQRLFYDLYNVKTGTIITADFDYIDIPLSAETPLTATDSATIDFTTSGTSNHMLTGSVKISATAGNDITVNPDGLFVDIPTYTAQPDCTLVPVGTTFNADDGNSYTAGSIVQAAIENTGVAEGTIIVQGDTDCNLEKLNDPICDDTITTKATSVIGKTAGNKWGEVKAQDYLTVRSVTASTTLAPATDAVILASASAGDATITLARPAICERQDFWVKRTDNSTNILTINGGGDLIDGVATITLKPAGAFSTLVGEAAHLVFDRTNNRWAVISDEAPGSGGGITNVEVLPTVSTCFGGFGTDKMVNNFQASIAGNTLTLTLDSQPEHYSLLGCFGCLNLTPPIFVESPVSESSVAKLVNSVITYTINNPSACRSACLVEHLANKGSAMFMGAGNYWRIDMERGPSAAGPWFRVGRVELTNSSGGVIGTTFPAMDDTDVHDLPPSGSLTLFARSTFQTVSFTDNASNFIFIPELEATWHLTTK